MSRFDMDDRAWDSAETDGKRATDSMFISGRLKDDLDTIQVAFLEVPKFGMVKYEEGDPARKGQVNVASFVDDKFEGVFLLTMSPTHMNRFIAKLRKPQYGLAKVYEIERHGVAQSPKTYYELDFVRELTAEETAMLETVDLHALFTPKDDTTPAPPTSAPPTLDKESYKEWNLGVVHEAKRLGWAADGSPTQAIKDAISVYFGNYIKGSDMDNGQRNAFIEAIRGLEDGAKPTEIGSFSLLEGDIDLEEDVDFF